MEQSILNMAADVVAALIHTGQLTPAEMDPALKDVFATLTALNIRQQHREGGGEVLTSRPWGLNWRKSLTRTAITCLECGAVYKQLSSRHLREHDLTAKSYRDKYGIPHSLPLAARETTARRRAAVQQIRPWEKAPAYLAGRAEATTTKKSPATRRKS